MSHSVECCPCISRIPAFGDERYGTAAAWRLGDPSMMRGCVLARRRSYRRRRGGESGDGYVRKPPALWRPGGVHRGQKAITSIFAIAPLSAALALRRSLCHGGDIDGHLLPANLSGTDATTGHGAAIHIGSGGSGRRVSGVPPLPPGIQPRVAGLARRADLVGRLTCRLPRGWSTKRVLADWRVALP